MEISFCIETKKELMKFLNESSSIILSRNKIIKKRKGRCSLFNTNKKIFSISLGLFLIWIGLFFIFISNISSRSITEIIQERSTIFLIAISFFVILWIKTLRKTFKEQIKLLNQRGILIINNEKIKMDYNGREISTGIDNAIAVIVGKHSINVVTDNNIVFNTPIITKDKVLNTMKKYKKDILIIELK